MKRRSENISFSEEIVHGKIVIVTGANKGIGKQVTLALAQRNATVIMACMNLTEAVQAIMEIRMITNSGILVPMLLNLASQKTVRKFVENCKKIFRGVDILINNAGVMMPDSASVKTEEGFEINFGINYLGHFLLTNLLLELLKNSKDARIVTVVSVTMKYGNIDSSDPLKSEQKSKRTFPPQSYSKSKLALAMFSQELSKRVHGSNIKTYSVCPGCVKTSFSDFSIPKIAKRLRFLAHPLLLSAEKASRSILYCALAKECSHETGQMYRRGKLWGPKIYPDDVFFPGVLPMIKDEDAEELWEASKILVNLCTEDVL